MSLFCSRQQRPIVILALLTAASLVGDSMLYVVLPTHWQEAGLSSLWEVGVLLSVNRLVRLPLNPLAGWLYQHISTRSGVLFATVLAVLTTAAYGLLQGFWPLLLARAVWGLAWTFLRIGSYCVIIDCSTDNSRGHAMGTFNGLYRLGSLVGMLAGGFIADAWGLKATALVFAAISLLAVPAAWLTVPPATSGSAGSASTTDSAAVWRDRNIVWALLTGLLVAMIYQGVFTATLSYLIEVHNGAVLTLAGVTLGAASLAGILQALRWGWEPWLAPWVGRTSDGKLGRRKMLLLSLALAGVLFALLPLPLPLWLWLLLILAIQITATALTTLTDAIASDAASASLKLVVLTAYSVAIDIGSALGPFVAYVLNAQVQAYAAYYLTAAVLLLLALVWRRPVP